MKGRARSALIGDRLLAQNLVVVTGSIAAGVLGFTFQSLISHRFRPADYGAAFAAMTLITLIGLPAAALTLLMARETSRDRAAGHVAASTALLRSGNRWMLASGCALALLVAAAAPSMATFLGIPTPYLFAVAANMPVALALPLVLGEFQGDQRFLSFSSLTAGLALVKLVAGVLLGIVLGPVGVVLGLAVAGTLVYGAALAMLRRKLTVRVARSWLRPALPYLALVLPSTLALSVLLSADVLLVKHFFSSRAAGEYAAVATLGRAIFWGAAAVATVLFPKIIFHESQGRSGLRLIGSSVGLVVLGGLVTLIPFGLASRAILDLFAGKGYSAGATYLPWYAVGMTLLGSAAVLIATHQSRARSLFLTVLVPVAFVEPLLILVFHASLMQVVLVLNFSMAALVAGLLVLLIQVQPPKARRDDQTVAPVVALAKAQP